MSARSDLIERLRAFQLAAAADVLVSKALTDVDHNSRARILRNGLAVVGFAMLEDFIKTRTGEVLTRVGGIGAPPFSDLPEGIRKATTSGVVSAMRFQENFFSTPAAVYAFHQHHARNVASTGGPGYALSEIAFGHDRSNLSAADVESILAAFHVDGPWSAMGSVASRSGVGVLSLRSAFDTAANRRHTAAHRANAAVESTELMGLGREIIAICLSFDLLISTALRRLLDADAAYLAGRAKVAGNQVLIRRIAKGRDNYWREHAPSAARAYRRHRDVNVLRTTASLRAQTGKEALVLQDQQGIPLEWSTPAID